MQKLLHIKYKKEEIENNKVNKGARERGGERESVEGETERERDRERVLHLKRNLFVGKFYFIT